MFIGLTTATSPSTVGQVGTFTFFNEAGLMQLIPLPSTTQGSDNIANFCTWKRGIVTRTYIFNQFSENLVATELKAVLRIGIQAPDTPWVNSGVPIENQVGYVTSGTGLTGSAVLYLRYYDSLHNRLSPLGGPSAAISLANQGISIVNAPLGPTPSDTGVDTLQVWVSLDGGLPRLWASRDIGAPNFLVNEAVTGEAETETLSQFPVLKFGVLANDALFAAGDPRYPNLLYVSRSGSPEEYTGITIPTRNGEEIIGLAAIGGSTVYVQCLNSSYYVQGFDESDLVMKPLEPKIGGLGHKSIASCHDVALVPTQLGWYICTGTALIPIGFGKWDKTWRDTLQVGTSGTGQGGSPSDSTQMTQGGFTVTDYAQGVVKYLGPSTVATGSVIPEIIGFPISFNSCYWILDIGGLVPESGPGSAPLSFDCRSRFDTCAAMLAIPGTPVGTLCTGDRDGYVWTEGVIAGGLDGTEPIEAIIHTHHDIIGDIAEEADAFQVSKVWPIFLGENAAGLDVITLDIYVGNDFAWQAVDPYSLTIPDGADIFLDRQTVPELQMRVPRSQVIKTPELQGSGISVRLTYLLNGSLSNEITWDTHNYRIQRQRTAFAMYGLGYSWVGGTEQRPLGLCQQLE